MIPHHPLQELHDLDKASPQFHEQLRDFLRGDVYRGALQNLKSEDLALLVEYLDSVSLHIIFPPAALNIGAGSRRNPRPCNLCFPGIPARTQEDLRCSGSVSRIVDSSWISAGIRVRRDLQWFKSADQTCKNALWRRPTENQGGLCSVPCAPILDR